jgi:hypothetical protein
LDQQKIYSKSLLFYAFFGGVNCPIANQIWTSLAPKKCKIFTWLAVRGRLKTRDFLVKKTIIENASCPYGYNEEENIEHMLFRCPHTTQIWSALGLTTTQTDMTALLSFDQNHPHHQNSELSTTIIAVSWNIWLARNQRVFDSFTI